MPLGEAVRADSTVTFVALKTGLFLGEGPERAGRIFFDDLEVPVPDIPQFSSAAAAHNGNLCGAGAAASTATGAQGRLRPRAHHRRWRRHAGRGAPVRRGLPACGCGPGHRGHGTRESDRHRRRPAGADLSAAAQSGGSGIRRWNAPTSWPSARAWVAAPGRRSWCGSRSNATKPLVVDADALNIIAESGKRQRDNWILTPHPGEAAQAARH